MGKIVLFVPREEMLYQAHNILQEKKYPIEEMRTVCSAEVVSEARRAISEGASIIIARGLQASLIKQYTDVPVVEIVLTAQEMALLIMRARQIVKKPRPQIAVVGFKNMFCDMSYFDELYEIRLRTYYTSNGDALPRLVEQAAADGADLVIGGDTVVEAATEKGIPSLFLSMTEESLRNAFSMAESMDYAMNVEKKSAAQIETILDNTYSGILRVDSDGKITAVNPLMEDILGEIQENLIGKNVRTVLPQLKDEALKWVLKDGREYSLPMEINQYPIFSALAPVLYDNRVDGAIITCRKVMKKAASETDKNKKRLQGTPALLRFEDILQKSPVMQECIRLAKLYALSEQPVVIMGEPGTEKRILAQGIHNGSAHRQGPFLDVPCDGLSDEEQRKTIFGEKGAAVQAQGGTLLIQDAESLTAANQYRLYQLIRFHICHGQDIGQFRKVDVRIIVTMRIPLGTLAGQGKLRTDLYYLLSGLEIEIPPLRMRPEDLAEKLKTAVHDACERYSRYHVLTEGAKKALCSYSWRGNLFQIDSYCDRLILTAEKRSIDEIAVNRLLRELYAGDDALFSDEKGQGSAPVYVNEEAERIAGLLKKYGGNREKTAKELGVSKATLWRHMKKYEITD